MTDDERTAALHFDPAVFAIARARMSSAPLALTEPDFAMLATVSRQLEDEARFAQKSAQLALVAARTAAPVQTKAAKRPAPDTMEEFLERYGTKHVTYKALDNVFDVLMEKWDEMNERNKERNARLDALETRVLELEAQAAAARTVQHAER